MITDFKLNKSHLSRKLTQEVNCSHHDGTDFKLNKSYLLSLTQQVRFVLQVDYHHGENNLLIESASEQFVFIMVRTIYFLSQQVNE